jgi:general secretion pathway protein L
MAVAPEAASGRAATGAAGVKLGALWRWWTTELAQLVPEALSPQGRVARLPLLTLDGDVLVLVPPPGATAPEVSSVDLAALDTARARAAVRALMEHAGETRGRARLLLRHEDALVRRVTMPLATEENLGQVLAFEMDRLTPFRAEDVYYDQRILSRDSNAGTLSALLAVARREVVEARIERLRAVGVSVQGVSLREEPAHPGAPIDLLPAEQRGERESRAERFLRRGLAAAVAVLIVAVLFLPIWQKRETAIALGPVVAKAKHDAEGTDALAKDLERQVGDYNFLLAKKHGQYPALAYVEEVSRLLPDNTWVAELQIKNTGKTREIQIQGETNSSSKLIETMEQSTLMQNAMTRGTVTRGSVPGTERFMISLEARQRPLPEALALADIPTPVTPAPAAGAAPPPAAPRPAAAAPAPAQPAPQAATVTPVPAHPAPPPAPHPAPAPAPAPATATPAPPAQQGTATITRRR